MKIEITAAFESSFAKPLFSLPVFWISYLDMVPQEVFCAEETGALVTHDEIQHLLLRNSFFQCCGTVTIF
jgi:hypothetical protein